MLYWCHSLPGCSGDKHDAGCPGGAYKAGHAAGYQVGVVDGRTKAVKEVISLIINDDSIPASFARVVRRLLTVDQTEIE
jgi:hypothetical protein